MRRREVLGLSAIAGATGVLTLDTVTFARAADGNGRAGSGRDGDEETRTVTGHLPTGAPDFVYLPVEVGHGVREIAVSYSYDKPRVPLGTPGNACDIGIFDERGPVSGGHAPHIRSCRGWSGGARTEFAISAAEATPGYLAGPVKPGTWHVVLGPYTVAPQGLDYSVRITLRYGDPGRTPKPVYPPERARGRGRAWYRGDCHLHSVHSDGKRTPAEIAAAARTAGLDFITTTEHNTTSSHRAWEGLWGDDLLIMTGEEITTRNGHLVALGSRPGAFIDWRYRARDDVFAHYARRIRQAGGLVVPAHPYGNCVGCNWKFGYEEADAIEVWNSDWTPDDEMSLNLWDGMLVASVRDDRRWIPAMGNSDAHREPQPVGLPQTVVLADDLSRQAIQDGIRAGRSWIAESSKTGLSFAATGGRGGHAGIGERLSVPPDTEVTVALEVSGAPGCTVRFITDQGELHAEPLPPSGSGTVSWRTTASYAAYARAEIRHPAADGGASGLPGAMAAMTNPVFLGER
ncbi:CehA/McbA family metallohydrolase [Streptomyces sp. H27-D2]|uniref:CehA/McbA family metallohydrolase n=1 Tax=Streptomyces sp. H27-D2 TaxID=3046304 RepID=UPI002DC04C8F|nr:CehA/McbA family metallohydrolase [Streptomyces sp. H27-D2]MEC4015331.1 CehA/McbA family metallohydrolase [Streptomyces sp. H27-D2]